MNISVVILTLDEEVNPRASLESVRCGDDVVARGFGRGVASVASARELRARVGYRQFDKCARQRTRQIGTIPCRNDGARMLDAAERMPADLVREMLMAVGTMSVEVIDCQLLELERRSCGPSV